MRVKFLGAAILALCFFIVGSTTFAEQISSDEAARLNKFFMNMGRGDAEVMKESHVIKFVSGITIQSHYPAELPQHETHTLSMLHLIDADKIQHIR